MARGESLEEAEASVRLGRRFLVMDRSGELWRERLHAAYQAFHAEHGRRPERGAERDLIRWNFATGLFRERHGRDPFHDAELKAFVAEVAKPPRQPVPGVDLVFTPVKSVSVLWVLADDEVRQQVTEAHEASWCRAFALVEKEAALTRAGAAGVAQVDTHGLVAAAFDRPDSRTEDPNLRTHVAVSAKVQGLDGYWRALDMRVLHAMAVRASETYDTEIEDELRTRLGARFIGCDAGRGKRPVREIDGIPRELLAAFSSRRHQVEAGDKDALARYREAHGHDAPRHVQYRLAQEATQTNRPDKAHPRSWARARQDWMAQAREVLERGPFGRAGEVAATIREVLGRETSARRGDEPAVADLARRAVETLAESRSTWTRWHIEAEIHRLTRPLAMRPEAARDAPACN